jgi:hypothetical protein
MEERLRQAYYYLAAHNSLLQHELEGVLGTLARARVPVLLLKGAALAQAAYDNVALRPMVDLDLLVPRARVAAGESALAGMGYTILSPEPWPGHGSRYRYAVEYVRRPDRGTPFYVGLHTHLLEIPYYERIPIDDWFARARPVPGASSGAQMPAPEDHLVYLSGHQVLQHGREHGLLRYVDLALLISRAGEALDWSQVIGRAADWRLVIPLQQALARLHELWPGGVPADAAAELGRMQPTGSELRLVRWAVDHPTPAWNTLLAVVTLPGLRRRAGYLLEQMFPSPAYMRGRYGPQRPGLWPLAYLRRAGTGLGHLLRRARPR